MWFVACKYLHFACILGLLCCQGLRFGLHRWATPQRQASIGPRLRGAAHALLAGIILTGIGLLGFAGERISEFYFTNAWFLIKMALLALAIFVGVWGNRAGLLGRKPAPDATGPATIIAGQILIILLIPLAALLMTRRVWMLDWSLPQPVKEQTTATPASNAATTPATP